MAFNCDDPEIWDNMRFEKPRPWRPRDNLAPLPERGWLIMMDRFRGDELLDIACWYILVFLAQRASREAGMKLYCVARSEALGRVLLVDPSIADDITGALVDLNNAMAYCNCGGTDCLESELQERAAKVIAARKWAKLSVSERMEVLAAHEDTEEDDAPMDWAFLAPRALANKANDYLLFDIAYNT